MCPSDEGTSSFLLPPSCYKDHLTFDYNGEENFFSSVMVCQKPYSDTELVIRYDREDRFYSFNFCDFQNSIVKSFHVTHADFIGKRIRQRLTNDEENASGGNKEL